MDFWTMYFIGVMVVAIPAFKLANSRGSLGYRLFVSLLAGMMWPLVLAVWVIVKSGRGAKLSR